MLRLEKIVNKFQPRMVSTSFIFLRNLAGSISSAGPILNNVNANGLPFLTFLLSNDDVVFDPTAPPSSLHRKGQRGSSPWTSNYQDEDDSIFYLDLPWGPPYHREMDGRWSVCSLNCHASGPTGCPLERPNDVYAFPLWPPLHERTKMRGRCDWLPARLVNFVVIFLGEAKP